MMYIGMIKNEMNYLCKIVNNNYFIEHNGDYQTFIQLN